MTNVAIIGAGPSGLVAAKEAIACGLNPTVFEKGSTIGGLWKPQTGFTWDGMHTNISHYTNRFSDFDWKEGVQDFPTTEEVYEYLCQYADHFKINRCISLNTEVAKVQRAGEHWNIEYLYKDEDGKLINQSTNFDHVILCSGIFSKAHIPEFPGLETFAGHVIHSKDYKNPDCFEGKDVVVIGNSFSGCEIASALATKTNHLIHVQRRPMWIVPRYLKKDDLSDKKLPCDLVFYSRAMSAPCQGASREMLNFGKNMWLKKICGGQEQISKDLQINTPFQHPGFAAITDTYLDKVECGQIQIHTGEVQEIQKKEILFKDGTRFHADSLILCTGYRADIPFLDAQKQVQMGFALNDPLQPFLLHKCVFPKELPNIACVGLYRGPFFGVMELQARLACMTFAHKIPIPTQNEIEKGINEERQIREADQRMQFPHPNYVQFCEDYAQMIGVCPNLNQMKVQDPELYKKVWEGPFSVASYRLEGEGKNPELARCAIDKINLAVQ